MQPYPRTHQLLSGFNNNSRWETIRRLLGNVFKLFDEEMSAFVFEMNELEIVIDNEAPQFEGEHMDIKFAINVLKKILSAIENEGASRLRNDCLVHFC